MNEINFLDKIDKLYLAWKSGQIPTLSEHEVHPDLPINSRERFLYFTLPVCINFQRSSPSMWQSALKTWQDPETNYLFFPELTAQKELSVIQKDLRKHSLSLQINKHATIWMIISQTLHKFYQNDPRNIFISQDWNCKSVLHLIKSKNRENFKYLRGEKLSNYWLYILWQYTNARELFFDIEAVSIIPDTHIIQASFKLELIDKLDTKPERVAEIWVKALENSNFRGIDLHPILWNWSRNNFRPEV